MVRSGLRDARLASAAILAIAAAAPAAAQRSGENAAKSADDAFGTSVGNERGRPLQFTASWPTTGQRRTREIGVRLALGARRRQIGQMMLQQGMRMLGIGLLIGFVAALATSRVLRSVLFQVSATDPLVYVGVSLLLGVAAAIACWIPARRASRVDPIITLRAE